VTHIKRFKDIVENIFRGYFEGVDGKEVVAFLINNSQRKMPLPPLHHV